MEIVIADPEKYKRYLSFRHLLGQSCVLAVCNQGTGSGSAVRPVVFIASAANSTPLAPRPEIQAATRGELFHPVQCCGCVLSAAVVIGPVFIRITVAHNANAFLGWYDHGKWRT